MKSVGKEHRQGRLMEIAALLLRRLVETEEGIRRKEDLTQDLLAEGKYTEGEIEEALALLFSASEKISSALVPRNDRALHPVARAFTAAERRRLTPAVQKRLLRYRLLGVLTEAEWEEIVLYLLYGSEAKAGVAELNAALRRVIEDERLLLLLPPPGTAGAEMGTIN
ncbi:MAG: DUF494 domain-containing protein [Firmicutes bacterium]|nr:DUF494 domain-containing protein [Bacillota bacterium]